MLLAVDTSTRRIGVAVFDGVQVLAESTWASPFHHTMELAPAVVSSLRYAGITAADLTAIGAAIGPGSYTALRTGLAFIKGLVLAHEIPVLGVHSLDITAASQPPMSIPVIAVLEAGRRRMAARTYTWEEGWRPAGSGRLVTLEELDHMVRAPTWICGELDGTAREVLARNPDAKLAQPSQSLRRPSVLAELAWKRWLKGEADDPALLSPVYLSTAGVEG